MSWTIHEGELDRDDVRELLAHHVAEMNAGSPPSACHVLAVDGLRNPAIRFFTLRENGALLGCGALKRLADGNGEIKSMRTVGTALRRGVGKALLDHLIAEARKSGMGHLSLETGSTPPFAAAITLYERAAFRPGPPFGDYAEHPFTRFFTREI